MITLYGIKNCDSVRKARRWIENQQLDYHFHDFRDAGIGQPVIAQWLERLTAERLVNRRSTTWKSLEPAAREEIAALIAQCQSEAQQERQMAIDTLATRLAQTPLLIKRPVTETALATTPLLVGFKDSEFESALL